MFQLDPAFEASSAPVIDLSLCAVRLQLDARFAWLILIPRQPGLVEIEDLSAADRAVLMDEILAAGRAVRAVGEAWGRPVLKLNIGALGNIVRQLHVHVVGRREGDDAWPGPVWGQGAAVAPGDDALRAALSAARTSLA